MKSNKPLRVAIFSPSEGTVSETFIRAHREHLPLTVISRYESNWRLRDDSGRRIWLLGNAFGLISQRLAPKLNTAAFNFVLARHLRRVGVDAVLAEYGITGADLVEGCKRACVPLFVHFHGFDASIHTVLDSNRERYRKMFDYASGIVAVSISMKDRLISLGAPPERLYVNVYGVDPKRFSGGSPEAKGPVFCGVGNFVEKKAPYLTVLAFSKVVQVVPEARLIMVGEGPLFGPCKRLATAMGIGSSVEFLGVKGPDLISKLMRDSRVFVQHSLEAENGDCEGTPVAVIEAQMTGLPVISTKHAGIPDVVVNGETGFIIDEGDMDGMSARMLQLARYPELAGIMGRAARERALCNYTLDRHLNQLAEMIEIEVRLKKKLK
jgi:colanic acid/amylovoran biosynthesis glycosyltransferase